MAYETICFNTGSQEIALYTSPNSFRPNRVSEAFIKSLPDDLSGKIVYDIGSGGGVIAITEALRGAQKVYAVEPAQSNFNLLAENLKRNSLENKVIALRGEYFDCLKEVGKADIITADVSGILDVFARALGWYPEGVKTGGKEGYEITIELLKRAPYHLKEGGYLLFPVANDLLDENKILDVARENFGVVKNALCLDKELFDWKKQSKESNGKMWRSPDYVWFPLRTQDIETLLEAYDGKIPKTINIQNIKGKYFWRGQIYKAQKPIIT